MINGGTRFPLIVTDQWNGRERVHRVRMNMFSQILNLLSRGLFIFDGHIPIAPPNLCEPIRNRGSRKISDVLELADLKNSKSNAPSPNRTMLRKMQQFHHTADIKV